MEYYKFVNNDLNTICIAIPSDAWIDTVKCLVFRDKTLGLPFEFRNDYDAIDEEKMFGIEALKEAAKVKSYSKITKAEFIENKGECHDYKEREDYFAGELPKNWYEIANETFLNNGLLDQLAANDDLQRVIDDDLYEYSHIGLIWDYMYGCDPVQYLENWSRYLYGVAMAIINK